MHEGSVDGTSVASVAYYSIDQRSKVKTLESKIESASSIIPIAIESKQVKVYPATVLVASLYVQL